MSITQDQQSEIDQLRALRQIDAQYAPSVDQEGLPL